MLYSNEIAKIRKKNRLAKKIIPNGVFLTKKAAVVAAALKSTCDVTL